MYAEQCRLLSVKYVERKQFGLSCTLYYPQKNIPKEQNPTSKDYVKSLRGLWKLLDLLSHSLNVYQEPYLSLSSLITGAAK